MLDFALALLRTTLKALRVILCFAIAVMLSACGKSDEEIRAEQIHKENVELAQKLLERAKHGAPQNSTWTPPKFDAPQDSGEAKR